MTRYRIIDTMATVNRGSSTETRHDHELERWSETRNAHLFLHIDWGTTQKTDLSRWETAWDGCTTRYDFWDHEWDVVREYGIYVLTCEEEWELIIDMYYQGNLLSRVGEIKDLGLIWSLFAVLITFYVSYYRLNLRVRENDFKGCDTSNGQDLRDENKGKWLCF